MPAPSAFVCSCCKSPLEFLGSVPVRVGGTSGGWHLLLGELADAGERTLTLDMYRCTNCRHLQMYDLDASLPGR
jgi:hypothetical protein